MVWITASEPDVGLNDSSAFAAAREILRRSPRLAVAFSGGVDSAVLLHLAIDELGGENVLALHARSILFPAGRYRRLCDRMLADFSRSCTVRRVDFAPLEIAGFAANPPDRCYLCKKRMYGEFLRLARDLGAPALADGANDDDDISVRPGWRAIEELAVVAPLRQAGIGKAAIRSYAERHGLINHDLPSQSCLATRFAPG
ncbi:MAG TPA: TIGR00268 family protein, partial [Desulfobulbaceae bacterium]|nr:TIGR00268 family protein [Desulfobulbaceae bacterium]